MTETRLIANNELHGRENACSQDAVAEGAVVPYDENLFERTRTQWHFGDWESLCSLTHDAIAHHPDRARLALSAASGLFQLGKFQEAHQFIRFAQDWGVSKKLVVRILIAGVHNSLGRISAISKQQERAKRHFENSIKAGAPGNEFKLLTQARILEQLKQLGILAGTSSIFSTFGISGPDSDHSAELPKTFKEEIQNEVKIAISTSKPNPYVHNRTLTLEQNKGLRIFANEKLKLKDIKSAYIDYLATRSLQLEKNCVGRLATTIQDIIARQLVAESIEGDSVCILEIGSLYGISLAILYNHVITRASQVKVAGLDPFDGYYGQAIDAVLNQPVNEHTFIRNMQLANVPKSDYTVIKKFSTDPEALSISANLPINLLIIDGDHSYEGVKFDFETYFPLLQPGGFVIFDDYNAKEWPGVQQFVDFDVKKANGFEHLGSFSRTAVGRKRNA